jgi:hypothetical protein
MPRAVASWDDDPRSETFLPLKPTRTRTRAPSDNGDRHIGHYWGSEISLLEGPLARPAPSGRSRPVSLYADDVRDVPISPPPVPRRDSLRRDYRDYDGGSRRRDYHDYNVGSRRRDYHDYYVGPRRRDYDRDSPRLDYDRDTRDYNYEDEEWDERDRMRRRRTPAPSERSPSPTDHKIMEKLKRLEELEMKEREMKELEKMRQELFLLNKLREKEEKEVREPAELATAKEPAKQEGEISLEKRDELDGHKQPEKRNELDGDYQPEKQEEAAKLGRHIEVEGNNESRDQEAIRIKLEALELERSRGMQKREEEVKQRMLLVKAKEEAEKLFEERVKVEFRGAGFSEEAAERMLKEQREKRAKVQERSSDSLGLNKKTYIKVHRKYIVPETLNAHHLPWEPDGVCLPHMLCIRFSC